MSLAGGASVEQEQSQALSAQRRGDHQTAARLFQAAINRSGPNASLFHHLGLSLRALGQLDDAISVFQAALAHDPSSAATLGCLGNALKAAGRFEEAVAQHTRAVELEPTAPEAWSNLGAAYEAWGREQAALLSFEQAASLRPSADLLANWAGALLRADQLDGALDVAQRAAEAGPEHPRAMLNLAAALRAHARYEEAIAVLRRAVEVDPVSADAHFNLGLVLLTVGSFQEGWVERHWRHHVPTMRPPAHAGPEPRWDGSPLDGRTLLLRAEQGLGDTLQFLRYARLVKQLAGGGGGRVLLQAPETLAPIITCCLDIDEVVPPATGGPARAHVEAPLLDLPYLLRSAVPRPPRATPYLDADPELVSAWRARVQSSGPAALRMGIVWQGNPRYPEDRRRSIPLRSFSPLLETAARLGAHVYILQKGYGREQIGGLPEGLPIFDLGPELDEGGAAFMDTAAVVANLDLVVTSDTALAHLAGAMAARVWTLLAHAPDWRWGHQGQTTPWYPTMRLFRQSRSGDWPSVLTAAAAALPAEIARRGGL